jgi:hypothetical protein
VCGHKTTQLLRLKQHPHGNKAKASQAIDDEDFLPFHTNV